MIAEDEYKELIKSVESWTELTVRDVSPHVLYQKAEQLVLEMKAFLAQLSTEEVTADNVNEHFVSSVYLRDFAVLLRDSLLAVVKIDQLDQDRDRSSETLLGKIQDTISQAARETLQVAFSQEVDPILQKASKHQLSPAAEIANQIDELGIQLKKIYRSHDKVNALRMNLETFKREFHVLFQRQTTVVHDLVASVSDVTTLVEMAMPVANKSQIEAIVEQISTSVLRLEELQSVESMEVLGYPEKSIINVPVDVVHGGLHTKVVDLPSEMSKWFSANIYPHIIELENRRNLALERSFTALNKVKVKLSAIILDEKDSYELGPTEAKMILNELNHEYLKPLLEEEKENTKHVLAHVDNELFASAIYDESQVFLPHKGAVQMTDISRQASKRMLTALRKYSTQSYDWLRNLLGKYVEINRTPYNAYIANKLLFDQDDERLSLFLKKGYLGKSFMVNRQDLIDPIFSDYQLWKEGFNGAVLIYGRSGAGKSALLGMLSQQQLTDEMIIIRAGEPYVTGQRAFSATYDLRKAVHHVAAQYLGKKIVLCVDDLQQWHSDQISLFQNLDALFHQIQKYRSDIFFVISCGDQLRARISAFRSLETVFSSQIEVGAMKKDDIREALMMRFRALPELGLTDTEHDNTIGAITRNAGGNVGHAMLEYCRFYAKDYDPNLKSKDFEQLVKDHKTLLRYITAFQSVRVQDLVMRLNDVDYRALASQVDFLVGNKILVRTRNGTISINPMLVYSIDKILCK